MEEKENPNASKQPAWGWGARDAEKGLQIGIRREKSERRHKNFNTASKTRGQREECWERLLQRHGITPGPSIRRGSGAILNDGNRGIE